MNFATTSISVYHSKQKDRSITLSPCAGAGIMASIKVIFPFLEEGVFGGLLRPIGCIHFGYAAYLRKETQAVRADCVGSVVEDLLSSMSQGEM